MKQHLAEERLKELWDYLSFAGSAGLSKAKLEDMVKTAQNLLMYWKQNDGINKRYDYKGISDGLKFDCEECLRVHSAVFKSLIKEYSNQSADTAKHKLFKKPLGAMTGYEFETYLRHLKESGVI